MEWWFKKEEKEKKYLVLKLPQSAVFRCRSQADLGSEDAPASCPENCQWDPLQEEECGDRNCSREWDTGLQLGCPQLTAGHQAGTHTTATRAEGDKLTSHQKH